MSVFQHGSINTGVMQSFFHIHMALGDDPGAYKCEDSCAQQEF